MAQMNTEAIAAHKWLLLGAEENPEEVPVHGVKFVFHDEPSGLRGAMVNWVTGDELPLATLRFDGFTLELQMKSDEDFKGENPTLTMSLVDEEFEGYWMNIGGEKLLGKKLKMVRCRK
jgi:hypothetical protein